MTTDMLVHISNEAALLKCHIVLCFFNCFVWLPLNYFLFFLDYIKFHASLPATLPCGVRRSDTQQPLECTEKLCFFFLSRDTLHCCHCLSKPSGKIHVPQVEESVVVERKSRSFNLFSPISQNTFGLLNYKLKLNFILRLNFRRGSHTLGRYFGSGGDYWLSIMMINGD